MKFVLKTADQLIDEILAAKKRHGESLSHIEMSREEYEKIKCGRCACLDLEDDEWRIAGISIEIK